MADALVFAALAAVVGAGVVAQVLGVGFGVAVDAGPIAFAIPPVTLLTSLFACLLTVTLLLPPFTSFVIEVPVGQISISPVCWRHLKYETRENLLSPTWPRGGTLACAN